MRMVANTKYSDVSQRSTSYADNPHRRMPPPTQKKILRARRHAEIHNDAAGNLSFAVNGATLGPTSVSGSKQNPQSRCDRPHVRYFSNNGTRTFSRTLTALYDENKLCVSYLQPPKFTKIITECVDDPRKQ